MSPEWLTHNGTLLPSTLVLSHDEQLDRLAASCPQAVPAALVAGDPCLDRMRASHGLRSTYRHALGVRAGQKLILVSSTWGRAGLFGANGDVVRRLRDAFPLDECAVALALHPNTWAGHSHWQIRLWLEECSRAGVIVLPPEEGWRAAVVAADIVVGDHGSVTFYAAALGRPVLLAAAPKDTVAPDSAVGRFLDVAPQLDSRRSLREQIDDVVRKGVTPTVSDIARLATSVPGRSAALLRTEFYRLLDLPEPDTEAAFDAVPAPDTDLPSVPHTWVSVALMPKRRTLEATVIRRVAGKASPGNDSAHLVVSTRSPRAGMVEAAGVLVNDRKGHAAEWIAETLDALPGLEVATMATSATRWWIGFRQGTLITVDCEAESGPLWASVLYQWSVEGRDLSTVPRRITIRSGPVSWTARVRHRGALPR